MTIKRFTMCMILLLSELTYAQNLHNLHFTTSSTNFYAAGRWTPLDSKKSANFPSETEINCDRLSKICIQATAELYSGHPHVSLDYFQILKWDENGIIAESSNGICMSITILITFDNKSITATHTMKKLNPDKKEACKSLGANENMIDDFIIKNSDRWNLDPYGESIH